MMIVSQADALGNLKDLGSGFFKPMGKNGWMLAGMFWCGQMAFWKMGNDQGRAQDMKFLVSIEGLLDHRCVTQ